MESMSRLLHRPFFFASFALLLVMLVSGCSNQKAANVRASGERKAAPAFKLKDSSGGEVKLADLKGKVVLLNFWATWCGPCEVEIPWFVEFEQKYKDQGFAVLGVSFDDDGWISVRPYMASHKINYRVAIGSDELSQVYGGVDSLPTSFIIDRFGRIAATHVGLVDKRDYQDEIIKLLQDPKAAIVPPGGDAPRFALLLRPDQRP
jgi:cytochrome c biogenesis protein CcmG/thiol:disulfide interchange protein DsbE